MDISTLSQAKGSDNDRLSNEIRVKIVFLTRSTSSLHINNNNRRSTPSPATLSTTCARRRSPTASTRSTLLLPSRPLRRSNFFFFLSFVYSAWMLPEKCTEFSHQQMEKFLVANSLYTFVLSFIANSTPALSSLPRSSFATLSRFPDSLLKLQRQMYTINLPRIMH